MILLIDNYDSFTYNLYQYIKEFDDNVKVIKNDEYKVDEIVKLNPSKIVISPGPKYPSEAGVCEELISKVKDIPILGICLGHQAIVEAYGGKIKHASIIMHGKSDIVNINNNTDIFKGLKSKIKVGRYHSLIGYDIPDCLSVISTNTMNEVMGVKHKKYPVYGLQFHPESILTEDGLTIIRNFIGEQNG